MEDCSVLELSNWFQYDEQTNKIGLTTMGLSSLRKRDMFQGENCLEEYQDPNLGVLLTHLAKELILLGTCFHFL